MTEPGKAEPSGYSAEVPAGTSVRVVPDGPQRRTLLVLALTTAIGSAGLAAGGTSGALLGTELAGAEAAAGLPLGLLVVGQAASGAALVVLATVVGGLVLLLAGSSVLGANLAVKCASIERLKRSAKARIRTTRARTTRAISNTT